MKTGCESHGWPEPKDGFCPVCLIQENERLRETARLAERFARAKGRHHSQIAMADLLEHFGLPAVRPGEDK